MHFLLKLQSEETQHHHWTDKNDSACHTSISLLASSSALTFAVFSANASISSWPFRSMSSFNFSPLDPASSACCFLAVSEVPFRKYDSCVECQFKVMNCNFKCRLISSIQRCDVLKS